MGERGQPELCPEEGVWTKVLGIYGYPASIAPPKAYPLSAACGQQTWGEHARSMEHSASRKHPRARELHNQQSAVSRAELSCFNLGTWRSLDTTKTKTSVPTLQSPAASPGQTKQGPSPYQNLEKTHRKKVANWRQLAQAEDPLSP